MHTGEYKIEPLGDHAVTVHFGNTIDASINRVVLELFECLRQNPIPGVLDIVPAYASLTVVYDTVAIKKTNAHLAAFDDIASQINTILQNETRDISLHSKTIHIPVCYDLSLGIDLETIALQKNMQLEDIIRLHHSKIYRVFMLGFLPGFAYMGTVDEHIAMPRKATPRSCVAAGSVGIAGFQTGIYPVDALGGWNIIGQTPLQMFSPKYAESCLLQPGDEVIFKPIGLQEFKKLKASR